VKKILIIDDEQDVLMVLRKRLTNEGYSVMTADNGNKGLSLAKSGHPDLIILDRMLGDMLGEEVAANLKKNPQTSNIPVIFLSCIFSKAEEAERNHLFGGDMMFAKPYDQEELVNAIGELI